MIILEEMTQSRVVLKNRIHVADLRSFGIKALSSSILLITFPSDDNTFALKNRPYYLTTWVNQSRNITNDTRLSFQKILSLEEAMGSFISVALVSLPALNAFRKLAISMDKLKKVVSEEVPGTLSSLKLSSLEINDLTSQLKYLRQRISGSQSGEKIRASKRRSHGGRI
ncbi:uncharacterized protein LOC109841251 isoform X2 [Asparagus officinalis]|uniref:uncharacterized protein LOC109841251 isoform X2 n=1 Tax=Asparagus officinalis TaxID=4686 RepID=UPI00098DF2DE|nr:uncharacterized protein LOC109841251 isoform X2 [Asparagus officinalis]